MSYYQRLLEKNSAESIALPCSPRYPHVAGSVITTNYLRRGRGGTSSIANSLQLRPDQISKRNKICPPQKSSIHWSPNNPEGVAAPHWKEINAAEPRRALRPETESHSIPTPAAWVFRGGRGATAAQGTDGADWTWKPRQPASSLSKARMSGTARSFWPLVQPLTFE